MEVLDAFGAELTSVRSTTANFRSKVLTPILQRHLQGVPDHYAPQVSLVISANDDVTIGDATKFYLGQDPTDPQWIPTYRRNILYVPEVRWHLCVVLGKVKLGDADAYNRIRREHDDLINGHRDDGSDEDDSTIAFGEAEVDVIVQDGLEEYFAEELANVVCTNPLLH